MRWPWTKDEPSEGEQVPDDKHERVEAWREVRDLLERAVNLGIEADNLLRRK